MSAPLRPPHPASPPPVEAGGRADAAQPASRRLDLLYARARATWPGVELPLARFEAHVARAEQRATDGAPSREPAGGVRAEELYLTAACLEHSPGALEALEAAHLRHVARNLVRSGLSATMVDECLEDLRTRLVVGDGVKRPPLLLSFTARGSLRAWIAVTATREVLARKARGSRELRLEDAAGAQVPLRELAAHAEPELALLRERFREAFPEAFRSALASLTPRQRNLLRYAYRERLGIDRLGALYGIHRATAARWVDRAREALAAELRARLGARLRLSESECGSALRLVLSALDASLPQALEVTSPQGRSA